MILGNKVEYKPYSGIGCYTRVYINGFMHSLIHRIVSIKVTSRLTLGLQRISNNRIIINEIR